MVLTIDKFGRVLIPKRVRQALNLRPGTSVNLEISEDNRRAYIEAPTSSEPELVVDEFGIPTFFFDTEDVMKYDFAEAIREDRARRGLSDSQE
jgi:AbrB family looped-hinge helix DNA binding protein